MDNVQGRRVSNNNLQKRTGMLFAAAVMLSVIPGAAPPRSAQDRVADVNSATGYSDLHPDSYTRGSRSGAIEVGVVQNEAMTQAAVGGGVTFYDSQPAFLTVIGGVGKDLKGLEDFEEAAVPAGGLATLDCDPLDTTTLCNDIGTGQIVFLPDDILWNLAFQTNMASPGLVKALGGGLAVLAPPFWGALNKAVGPNLFDNSFDILSLNPNHTAVSLSVVDLLFGPGTPIEVRVFDKNEFLLGIATVANAAPIGKFVGIVVPDPGTIGRINLRGHDGLGTEGAELVYDITAYVAGTVVGKCRDTGTLCTADDECEGTCDVAGTSCVADADCPAGACSFNGSCSESGQACSGAGSCASYCPTLNTTGCTPGTCCFDIGLGCISTCVSQTCNDPPAIPCDVDLDCPYGSCSWDGVQCHEAAECATGACSFDGTCSFTAQACSQAGSCPGICPATLLTGCTPGTCCFDVGGCLSTCVSQTCDNPTAAIACDVDTDCPDGSCDNSAQTCRSPDECGICDMTGGPCVSTASCPFVGVCSTIPNSCGALGGNCPGYCPATLTLGCTPGTCCIPNPLGGCFSTCQGQSCGGGNQNVCQFGSCVGAETCVGGSQTCDGAETCLAVADVCLEGSNVCCGGLEDPGCCENDSQCTAFATKCRPGFCELTTNRCLTGDKAAGCCEADSQCPGVCDICDLDTNQCVKGIPGCCTSDAQCGPSQCCDVDDFFSPNRCVDTTDGGCCDNSQCPGKCEFCELFGNECMFAPPNCCETDAHCGAFATKCRPGLCDTGQNRCFTGSKAPNCCEDDAQCAEFATKCSPGLCDFETNTCFAGPKTPADCCESDAQCADMGTKCRPGICNLTDNRCVLGPKIPEDCCETDAQCADFATKCRPGLCDFHANGCYTGPKTPADCCEDDAQCADMGTKCRPGVCELVSNRCVLGPKIPQDCCESDAQCLGKCEWCNFSSNRCEVLPPESCCETDADCPGKCDICDTLTNQCFMGIPGCCDAIGQCGKCAVCILSANTCTVPFPGCCVTDEQCFGKCEICDTMTNECIKGVPNCCTSDAQCNGCDQCNLQTNTCFPVSCCTPSSPPGPKPKNPTNRYLLFKAGDPKQIQAIRVVFEDLPIPYDSWNNTHMWVGQPFEVCENSGKGLETAPEDCPAALPTDTFWAAPLVCEKAEAHYMDWHGQCVTGTCVGGLEPGTACLVDDDCQIKVALHHEGVVPSGFYRIQVIGDDCQNELEDDYSDPLMQFQSLWGDVCGPSGAGACTGPVDGTVDVTNDVLGILDKFTNVSNLQKARGDLEPREVDFKVNVANDVLFCLDAFTGGLYPFLPSGGPPCP